MWLGKTISSETIRIRDLIREEGRKKFSPIAHTVYALPQLLQSYPESADLKFFGPCSCPDDGSDGVCDDGGDAGGGGVPCTVCQQAAYAYGASCLQWQRWWYLW